MYCRITDKRRKEIVNAIANIVVKLKNVNGVEAIAWEAYKGVTPFRNALSLFCDDTIENDYSYTGNELGVNIIINGNNPSPELNIILKELYKEYNKKSTKLKLGVDIKLYKSEARCYQLLSASDCEKIMKLHEMRDNENISLEEVIDYINYNVYKYGEKVNKYCKESKSKNKDKIVKNSKENIIFQALKYIDSNWVKTRGLNLSQVVLDNTEDQRYIKIANQFNGHKYYPIPKKKVLSHELDLGIEDQVLLNLKNTNYR